MLGSRQSSATPVSACHIYTLPSLWGTEKKVRMGTHILAKRPDTCKGNDSKSKVICNYSIVWSPFKTPSGFRGRETPRFWGLREDHKEAGLLNQTRRMGSLWRR